MALDLLTTSAGRNAILGALQAQRTITATDVQLSATLQPFTEATTALSNVVTTLPAQGSVRAVGSGFVLRLVVLDESNLAYTLRALAVRLASGTLLMGASPADPIATKAADSSLSLALDLRIDESTAQTLVFGTTDFALPAATTERPGLVRLATALETERMTSPNAAIMASNLGAALGRGALHKLWMPANVCSPTALASVRTNSLIGLSLHRGTLTSGGSFSVRFPLPALPRSGRITRAWAYFNRSWTASDAVLRFSFRWSLLVRRATPAPAWEISTYAAPMQQGGGAVAQREMSLDVPIDAAGLPVNDGSLPGASIAHEALVELSNVVFNASHTADTNLVEVYGFGLEYTAPTLAPFVY